MTKESEDKKEQRAREGAQAWADYQTEAARYGLATMRGYVTRLQRRHSN